MVEAPALLGLCLFKFSMDDSYLSVADFYDHVIPYRERTDVAFFVDAARESGGYVLELGCGTGRLLIPTARAGNQIVGLDYSTQMLDICRQRLSAESDAVRAKAELVQGDMRHFDLGRCFTLATIPFRAFQHLIELNEQLACLTSVRRHLEAGGRLILDLFNPSLDSLVNDRVGEIVREESPFDMPDGRRVIRRHRFTADDRTRQVRDVELIYDVTHSDGRQERLLHSFPFRYIFRFEAEHLLARAGFEVEHLYADHEKTPFGSKYPGELIFVAKKT